MTPPSLVSEWIAKLEDSRNSCEFDNDLFVEQALSVLREMKELVGAVEIFEKE